MRGAAALVIGYVLGSVLPANIFGRLRGVDLRTAGDGNLGTQNASAVLGRGPAIATALFDVLKGPASIWIAYAIGAPPWAVYAAGFAAIVGHRYPFYLGFRGGRGFATASGLLIFAVALAAARGWLTAVDAGVLLALYIGLWAVFRDRGVPNALALPVVAGVIAYRSPDSVYDVFLVLTVAYIWVHNARRVRAERLLRLRPEAKAALKDVRVILRPLALAFPALYLFLDKRSMLVLVGLVAAFFLIVDAVRLLSKRVNVGILRRLSFFYRPNEEHAFSSATLFLVGSFLTLFLFPKPVAGAALAYVIVGDLVAKYAGLQHGRTRVFSRTLEGSLMYFIASAAVGFVWSRFVPLPPLQYLLGALAAAATEMVPWDLNDNFTVPVVSGAVMMLPVFFGAYGG